MQSYHIYLIRHGMTASNLEGRFVGKTDLPLCPEGIAGLASLMESGEYPNVGLVYTSPLLRCVQTAHLLYPQMDLITIPQLREFDFGDFENKSLDELKNDSRFLTFMEHKMKSPAPGGSEGMAQFESRVLEGFEVLLKDMMKKQIFSAAVVTHGGVIMTLLGGCGLPRTKPSYWSCQPGEGYGILLNLAVWSNARNFEIGGKIPYRGEPEQEAQYHLVDPEYIRSLDQSMGGKDS